MTIAERIADKVLSVDFTDLPDQAVHWSKLGILDTIAVTLAGAPEECTRLLLGTPGVADAPGPCRILGTARRTSALDACLVNGTASHALDYDDVNNFLGGHPSAMLVPPLLAIAEMPRVSGQVSGRDAIAAYVAGFELETQLGRAVNYHHYEKGWHPTVTLGIFGTVATSARLLGLDRQRTATALAMAVSLASGVKANFGTMTKPLHVGQAVRNGLFATLLARDGFTASLDAFEEKQGFFEVFNGTGTYEPERIFDGWGAPFEVMGEGPGLKQHPCCGSTHAAIDCGAAIRRDHGVPIDQVTKIEVLTNPRRLPHTDNPNPRGGLEGKFSMQYVVARALADGLTGLAQFEDDAVNDPAIRPLMATVVTGVHPEMGLDSQNHFGAEVTVTTVDGEAISHRINNRVCRGPSDPMSEEEFTAKVTDCVTRVLPERNASALMQQMMDLDALGSLSALGDLLETSNQPVRAAGD